MTTERQTVDNNEAKPKKRIRKRSGKKAWVFQFARHVEKYGKKASWYVGWIDPRGKRHAQSCGPGERGRTVANRLADKLHSQLVTGTYESKEKTTWAELLKLYEARVLGRSANAVSAETARRSLAAFTAVMKPNRVKSIDTGTIDDFRKRRLVGCDESAPVAPSTVNRELRYVRHALRRAKRWGIVDDVPEFEFARKAEKMPTFVPPEHFAAIYTACDHAKRPKRVPNVKAADWWRALLVTAYMTGWRVGQILALKWADVDLDAGTALSQAEHNKGNRDAFLPLHPLVVEHLRKIQTFGKGAVFAWDTNRRAIWDHFDAIQQKAKLPDGRPLPKAGKGGYWYGFHDLRRGFATLNADKMDLFQLQTLMQHRDLSTTKLYVAMAARLRKPVENLYVPDLGKRVRTPRRRTGSM